MMKISRGHKTDTVLVLIIFSIFAVSVLLVLALSASIYRNMTELSQDGYDERTALSYVWTVAKNNDNAGSVSVGEFNGLSALIIEEQYGETSYSTTVYAYEGWLYVLFSETGLDFMPWDGVLAFPVDDMTFEQLEYGLIRVTSGTLSMLVSPRGTG